MLVVYHYTLDFAIVDIIVFEIFQEDVVLVYIHIDQAKVA